MVWNVLLERTPPINNREHKCLQYGTRDRDWCTAALGLYSNEE